MKLNYDKKSNDPTYFIQVGFRNGKKTSTRNVTRIGKHSELLAIDPDPLAYAKRKLLEANEAQKHNKLSMSFEIDFDEKLTATGDYNGLRKLNKNFLKDNEPDIIKS